MAQRECEDDSDRLEAIFDRYFDQVYGYVAYRLAPQVGAAEDLCQEVFLAAVQNWRSYRGDGAILAWLRGIARRKVADFLRLRGRTSCQVGDDSLFELAAARGTGPGRRALLLAQAMHFLPPDYVELLEQKYLDGLSVRQMARMQGRTEKAIESALSRARCMLKSAFLRLESRQERSDEHTRL